jgi:hypothetical protein
MEHGEEAVFNAVSHSTWYSGNIEIGPAFWRPAFQRSLPMNIVKRSLQGIRRRGFTTIETLIALAIGLGIVFGLGSAAYGFSTYLSNEASYVATRTASDAFLEQLQNDATSAIAVYVPPPCAAVDASCGELRFYAVDAAGMAHFWGYRYDGAAEAIERCTYASWNGSCAQKGDAVTGVTSFAAKMAKVTDLNLPELGGYVPQDVAIEQIDPAQDVGGNVMAGNRVAMVDFATKWQAQDIHLLAGGKPFRLDVVMNTVTPPPTSSPTPPPPSPSPTPTAPPPTAPPTASPAPTATPKPICLIVSRYPVITVVCYSYLGDVTTQCDATTFICNPQPMTLCMSMGGDKVFLVSSVPGPPGYTENTYSCWTPT